MGSSECKFNSLCVFFYLFHIEFFSQHFVHLDDFSWTQVLKTYGLVDSDTLYTNSLDQELNLLPSILEKIIVPRFSKILATSFNPCGIEAARNVFRTISNFEEILDPLNPSLLVSL